MKEPLTPVRAVVPFVLLLAGIAAAARTGLAQAPDGGTLPETWPVQTRAMFGLGKPQDPASLPRSEAGPQKPVAKIRIKRDALEKRGPHEWALVSGWRLAEAKKADGDGPAISTTAFNRGIWMDATVPGTVLTSMIDDGIYPDPDYGLNNLAIPESLSRQDYWYRIEFVPPAEMRGRRLSLTFNGINYAAEVWLNERSLGKIKGAFIRGNFDVTDALKPGESNALAVRISPPPHPGIAHEQSVKAGPGDNGGMLCLDGPTFICTEGWDWIPGIRDRNSGIWQDVTIAATGAVTIGDTHVVTKLPLPAVDQADVRIEVPLRNGSAGVLSGTLTAGFEGVSVSKTVTLPPGDSVVKLAPEEFPQLTVRNPRLWWPNGYGNPELYHLTIAFSGGQGESDAKKSRFGIREISYELTLGAKSGQSRRVEYRPTLLNGNGAAVIDVTHEGTFKTSEGWVESLRQGAENSPAILPLEDRQLSPYLVIRVNGVRIAARGGNWGMDDSRKRVSRERLEPYFRLHREAHFNLIRNWCGQNTEEIFYDLADEYGLLIWNDFWDSTQNYNLEPDDSCLFLKNARDTILRYRNHPSIAMWCGRNEGVPSPAVNTGLDELTRELDGTRHYMASSNTINLQNSGPYKYQNPADYFTRLGRGFAVEVGIPSVPTLDSLRSWLPAQDQWPPNDTWSYHDWHRGGNGDVAPLMKAMADQFGAPAGLEDFERKAQMLNYELHRALFEGLNAGLWTSNSGRLMWMTHPSWPSTVWQVYSSDYDTQASFYGAQKACEPIHVQMNLDDATVAVINNGAAALEGVIVKARVFDRDGRAGWSHEQPLKVGANSVVRTFPIDFSEASAVAFVELELRDSRGALLSGNFYLHARQESDLQSLNDLPKVELKVSARQQSAGETVRLTVQLENVSEAPCLMTRVTVRHSGDNSRVLPAYYSSNYVSLMPGEKTAVQIECPAGAAQGKLAVSLAGWNVNAATIDPEPMTAP